MTKLPWVFSGLVLAAAIYVCILLLNAGVALDDARSEVARQRERNSLALSVIREEWVGRKAADVAVLSIEFERQGVIVGTEGEDFEIGDLIFEVKKGVVADVHYID